MPSGAVGPWPEYPLKFAPTTWPAPARASPTIELETVIARGWLVAAFAPRTIIAS